jgi:DNA end-binding protein Ku
MPRPSWSGTIQISLVSFAVDVFPAVSATRPISFHEVDRKTMGRIHHQNVSTGPAVEEGEHEDTRSEKKGAKHASGMHIAARHGEGEAQGEDETEQHSVVKSDVVKSYEYAKGKYAIVEPEELKNLRLAGKKTVEISEFVKQEEIDPALYEKPYFVIPKAGPQAKAFAVVRQGMVNGGVVGIGEIVFGGRQHLMVLAPPHDSKAPGMRIYALRFASELRDVHDYAGSTERESVDAAQLKLAKQLIDAHTAKFEPSKYIDHYEEALTELVEAKIKHLPLPAQEPEKKRGKVIDLTDALRRSLAQRGSPSREDDRAEKAAAKRSRNQEAKAGEKIKSKSTKGRVRIEKKSKSA